LITHNYLNLCSKELICITEGKQQLAIGFAQVYVDGFISQNVIRCESAYQTKENDAFKEDGYYDYLFVIVTTATILHHVNVLYIICAYISIVFSSSS